MDFRGAGKMALALKLLILQFELSDFLLQLLLLMLLLLQSPFCARCPAGDGINLLLQAA